MHSHYFCGVNFEYSELIKYSNIVEPVYILIYSIFYREG